MQFSTQAFYIHITVWKGCGITPMALCCLRSMPFGSSRTHRWTDILTQAQSDEALGSIWNSTQLRWKQGCYLQLRTSTYTLQYGADVATLPWGCAACHPCHLAPGELSAGLTFWLRLNLRPFVLVGKYPAEVEARLLFATQAFYIHITVWKGCGNTPMALCCLPSMSFGSRRTQRWTGILAQAQPEESLAFSWNSTQLRWKQG